ncbi:hypothetical protein [Kitasatospora sp. NPDC002965]|uniref:hypothetical protein n=1 Tax=Kitasatospora sp. NPDC002965 TaxID=3154775 RepID=UPI0033BF5A65
MSLKDWGPLTGSALVREDHSLLMATVFSTTVTALREDSALYSMARTGWQLGRASPLPSGAGARDRLLPAVTFQISAHLLARAVAELTGADDTIPHRIRTVSTAHMLRSEGTNGRIRAAADLRGSLPLLALAPNHLLAPALEMLTRTGTAPTHLAAVYGHTVALTHRALARRPGPGRSEHYVRAWRDLEQEIYGTWTTRHVWRNAHTYKVDLFKRSGFPWEAQRRRRRAAAPAADWEALAADFPEADLRDAGVGAT